MGIARGILDPASFTLGYLKSRCSSCRHTVSVVGLPYLHGHRLGYLQDIKRGANGRPFPYHHPLLAGRASSLSAPLKAARGAIDAPPSSHLAFKYGINTDQGFREDMEDDAIVVENTPGGFLYAAVFDGHVGTAAVKYLKRELLRACLAASDEGKALEDPQRARSALVEAFEGVDERLLPWLATESGGQANAGSTASALFVRPDAIVVAHVGDCKVVLSRKGRAVDLCEDHRPFGATSTSINEIRRLRAAGAWVSHGRVCGSIAVSRAFGDAPYKTGRDLLLENGVKAGRWNQRFVDKVKITGDWLTATPDVSTTELAPTDEFVLVASDGLWDAMKSQQAVDFVRQELRKGMDPQWVTEELTTVAIRDKRTQDNVSIILITFRELAGT